MKRYIGSSRNIIAFPCPKCTNVMVYDTERDVYSPADVDYHDVCVCEECGAEFYAIQQYDGKIRFAFIPEE